MDKNYYDILEVSSHASAEAIEAVYKRLAKKYHPDLHEASKKFWAEKKMKEINEAYDTLKDPIKRRQYDVSRLTAATLDTGLKSVPQSDVLDKIKKLKAEAQKSPFTLKGYERILVIILIFITATFVVTASLRETTPKEKINIKPQPTAKANPSMSVPKPTKTTATTDNELADTSPTSRYFTIGSTKEVVERLMGDPTVGGQNTWSYDASMVYFDVEGKVEGWCTLDHPLKVRMGKKQKNADPFTVGSTPEEVVRAMGTPTSVLKGYWTYGESSVFFDEEGRVTSWSEVDRALKAQD